MRFLLDTHTFLWANAHPERLGNQRNIVEDRHNDRIVSAVVSWEIAIKVGLGRLHLPAEPDMWIPARLKSMAAIPIGIEHRHTFGVSSLPPIHRDPFDRLLVAQAQALQLPIMTADTKIAAYDVEVLMIHPS